MINPFLLRSKAAETHTAYILRQRMGALLNLLTSDHFRNRIGMYVGSTRFDAVSHWLGGYEYRVREAGEPDDLDGFYEWLIMRFTTAPPNIGWLGIIGHEFGTSATTQLFDCLDRFLKDREQVGLHKIVQSHADYELSKYGFLSTSRLGTSNPYRFPSLSTDQSQNR
jgi:hypothetical protein